MSAPDFFNVRPDLAPEGEDLGAHRVVPTAQAGSMIDVEAREMLGRLRHNADLDPSIRRAAARALSGEATIRDVFDVPAFRELSEKAAVRFREQVAEETPEQVERRAEWYKETYSGEFGLPRRPGLIQ